MQPVALSLLLAFTAVTSACVSAESAFLRSEADHRDELARRYPTGTRWGEPADWMSVFARWDLSDQAPDWFAQLALGTVQRRRLPAVACVYGFVPRWGSASLFGPAGAWCDYVFLDAEDRIVVAFRRFVD